MSLPITERTRAESEKANKKINIVLEIDGVSELFTAQSVKTIIKIGDPGFEIGDEFTIGGLKALESIVESTLIGEASLEIGNSWSIGDSTTTEGQAELISFQSGTSTEISQAIEPDKGSGETVPRFQVALVDKNERISNLLAPGNVVEDVLGKSARIWFGYVESAWRDDYIIIHRGLIDDFKAGAGLVTVNIAHPDQKKRSEIFLPSDSELTAGMSAVDTTASVDSTDDFLETITGPGGGVDTDFRTYIRVDDEVMRYTAISGNDFTGLTRAQLGTISTTHSIGAEVSSFYRLGPGNVIDMTLKLLLGGVEDFYETDIQVKNFVRVDDSTLVDNAILINNTALNQTVNPQIGDFVTTIDATNGANNVSSIAIVAITQVDSGFYLVLDNSVTLTEETATGAKLSLRSKFDVWPVGAGLGLTNEEVDIREHELLKSNFLSSTEMDFYIKDSFDGKEFITDQILNPISTFPLPRKAQTSIGIQRPPIPGSLIKTLDADSVLNIKDLKIQRSINKKFFNVIKYTYEERTLLEEFPKKRIRTNADSIQRIPNAGNKKLEFESKGLREVLSAVDIIDEASQRRLNKYKFGAEFIKGVKVSNVLGFNVEPGDGIIVDYSSLKLSDSVTGTRQGEARVFTITNKKFNIKNGQVTLDIEDTNVDKDLRFGLISPSSFIKTGNTASQFIIEPSFNTDEFGNDEFRKWDLVKDLNVAVIIRSVDYSTSDVSTVATFNGNTVTLQTALGFTPSAGMIMEFDDYNAQPDGVKLLYAFMNDGPFFDDSGVLYVMF